MPAKTKEQFEAEILETLAEYRNSSGPSMESRRQTMFARLVELVFKWCRNYPVYSGNIKIDPQEIGLELYETVTACVKQPINGKPFIAYLKTALKNARTAYSREYESGAIKIPDKKLQMLNKINQVVEMAVHNKGRNLTNNESAECIKYWFNITDKKAQEYLKWKNMVTISVQDDEIDQPDTSADPQDAYLSKLLSDDKTGKTPEIKEAIESVFMSKQQRTRDCLRALFTVKHIDSLVGFEGSFSFIDTAIVETYKKEKKLPNQYDTYLKYHPQSAKNSAEASASRQLEKFEQEIFLKLKKFR